jgi:2-C-methyl-D-erythritol 4-phosphate cytidylyltransferase
MNIAIIFAGGVGKRMNMQGAPKQFLNLYGKPVLIHALERFEKSPLIDKIVVVMLSDYIDLTKQLVKKYGISKVEHIVPGGETGQDSIFNGIDQAKKYDNPDGKNIVLIHDGVRPIFEEDLIERVINSVNEYGSAISCIPSNETTIIVDDNKNIIDTTNRAKTFIARAPQAFFLNDIYDWHMQAQADNNHSFVDSCSLMQRYCDRNPHIVETCFENIKITTPSDFYTIRALLEAKNDMDALGVSLEDYQ